MRAWLEVGDRVECPCCGGTFRRFLPHGPFRRPNVACPACGSHERHRLLWLFLTAARPDLLERSTLRLLHFAPEPALQRLLRARSNVDYVSADLGSPLADHDVDIQDLPYPDASFDALICSHVLEHVPDDRRAMRELHRIVEPGGWAIVMVPVHGGIAATVEDPAVVTPEQRLRAYGQADHLRLYGLDFPARLGAAGFEVEVVDYGRQVHPGDYERYGLTGAPIYLCARAPIRALGDAP